MTETLILGGPGCGKTTELLRIVETLLARGIPPERIAYLAFTRKAAIEARDRSAAKFGFSADNMPYFRTLHSFAFAMLGITREQLMTDMHYAEIGNRLNLKFSRMSDGFGLHAGGKDGDRHAYVEQLARLCEVHLQGLCLAHKMDFYDVKLYKDTTDSFKIKKGLFDFTDILQAYCERGFVPQLDVLIVDEAQDLSPLQWRAVRKLVAHVPEVYYAGDDDQAIYKWAGADVNYFLNLRAERKILPISYRLPRAIFNVRQGIVTRVGTRYAKNWQPHAEGGSVNRYAEPDYVDMREGTWLLLARNKYMLEPLKAMMHTKGHPYLFNGKSSVDNDTVRSVLLWEGLRKGKAYSGENIKLVYKKLDAKCVAHGSKSGKTLIKDELYSLDKLVEQEGLLTRAPWTEVIKMPSSEREYYRSLLRNGEGLLKEPRINISSIHGVKGGEAQHVLVLPDLSYSAHASFVKQADDEARVFYVAASRAKESLHVIHPKTRMSFPILSQQQKGPVYVN